MERRLDADGEPYTREEWLEYYGDVEGAERWSDALPAKAVASELGVWPSDDEDVLPPAKHRSRASKGYCEAATIDIIAEDDGNGAPRRKKAPGIRALGYSVSPAESVEADPTRRCPSRAWPWQPALAGLLEVHARHGCLQLPSLIGRGMPEPQQLSCRAHRNRFVTR